MQKEQLNNTLDDTDVESVKNTQDDSIIGTVNNPVEQINKKPKSILDKWEQSPYWIISGSYKVLYSIWMIVMAVGMFLAWLIALLAT